MTFTRYLRLAALGGGVLMLAACGGGDNIFSKKVSPNPAATPNQAMSTAPQELTVWELFDNKTNPDVTIEVNKYLWNAALDVLSFLPIETVDPFSGVFTTGYGTPPGGGRAYRATVLVQDPALDARSLKVALQTRDGGAVSIETQRAVEDAILTRARQLRQRDSRL